MDDRREFIVLAFVWNFVTLIVCMSVYYAPAARIVLSLLAHKMHFASVVLAPLFLISLWGFSRISELVSEGPSGKLTTRALTWLVWYCLYVVLLTGGVAGSPLSSLAAIIPLIAGGYIASAHRRLVLGRYVAGVVVVGGLSIWSGFAPPQQYPSGSEWALTGNFNAYIATAIIALGIVLEMMMLSGTGGLADDAQLNGSVLDSVPSHMLKKNQSASPIAPSSNVR
jgi:hypothetical protein